MRVARLDLLRHCMDVAETALERAPGEDRVDTGGLVGPVGDGEGVRYRMRAGEACTGAVRDVDRGIRARAAVDLGRRVDQIAAGGAGAGFGARQFGLNYRIVGEPAGAARGL